MNHLEIAHIFDEIAMFLELRGENPFKIRAYRTASDILKSLGSEFDKRVQDGSLHELKGIGKDLEQKIITLYQTGKLDLYDELKKKTPKGLVEMLKIPGLGAKKVKALFDKLGIDTMAKLKSACQKGSLERLEGFGKKTEENILDGILHLENYEKMHLYSEAIAYVEPILKEMRELPQVDQAEIAGSVRRKKEIVRDLDFIVSSSDQKKVVDWFTTSKFAHSVTAKGTTKASIRLRNGMQADLRVVPKKQYAFALYYFTGSKQHNIALRKRARKFGYSLNEYELKPLDVSKKQAISKKAIQEKDILKALKLQFIPPELREDMGEIEAAEKKKLPKLIEESDIQGTFHNHTTSSDGKNTLEEMANAAEKMGWKYLGIADHSQSSTQANGLNAEELLKQVQKIKKFNASKKHKIHLFSGVESDILKDGSLDYPDDVLKELDYIVVSIHRGFKMDEKTMTKRIIKALENPYTTMLGHMTGRLLLKREPYLLNKEKVIDACIANGKIIEINAQPQRLDIDWRLLAKMRDKNLLLAINTDAHSVENLQFYRFGVNIAKKGWVEKNNVINTYSLEKVKKALTR